MVQINYPTCEEGDCNNAQVFRLYRGDATLLGRYCLMHANLLKRRYDDLEREEG